MATNTDVTSYGERISAMEANLQHVATKADINRLDGKIDTGLERLERKIDTNHERLSGQIKWLIVLVLLALAASAPDVIALLR